MGSRFPAELQKRRIIWKRGTWTAPYSVRAAVDPLVLHDPSAGAGVGP